jgi:hypothetical protein
VKLTWGLNAKVAHLYLKKKILKEEVLCKDIVTKKKGPQESEMHGRGEDAAKVCPFVAL